MCPTEIIAFSDRAEEFRKIGCEVLACSTDSHYSHFAWVNTPRKAGGLGEMKIPLLADTNHSIARDYGVLIETEGIAFRGLFIIDVKGVLRQITINDLPVGRDVDETLRLVQAFQYTDKHGEGESDDARAGSINCSVPGRMEARQGHDQADDEGQQGVLRQARVMKNNTLSIITRMIPA